VFEHLDDPRPPAFGAGARHTAVRRAHRRRRRRLAGGLGVAAAALMAGAGGLYGRAAWRAGQIDRIDVASTGPVADGEPVTFLLRGVDGVTATGGRAGRSDTLLLARLDPAAGTASVLSVPRDLLVREPAGATKVRINELPVDSQVSAVESQLGVPVDHVVEVDFAGFQALVERAGGVRVRVDAPVRDRVTGLYIDEPGCVTLGGEQALALVRSRHTEVLDASGRWVEDPMGDLARTALQRAVLVAALADLSGRVDPFSADRLAGWAVEHLSVDESLGADELVDLARSVLALDPAAVTEMLLPVVPAPEDVNRLAVDPAAGPPVIDAFREGTGLPQPPGAPPPIAAC
jgi:LCP family protein required for cell wall assembly